MAVTGAGEDGAAIDVRVASTADIPEGAQRGELLLTATVWEERPFDWWSIAEWLLVGLVFVALAVWGAWRHLRYRERRRLMSRI